MKRCDNSERYEQHRLIGTQRRCSYRCAPLHLPLPGLCLRLTELLGVQQGVRAHLRRKTSVQLARAAAFCDDWDRRRVRAVIAVWRKHTHARLTLRAWLLEQHSGPGGTLALLHAFDGEGRVQGLGERCVRGTDSAACRR